MQVTSRLFLRTPFVDGRQQALAIGVLVCVFAAVTPSWAQTQWREVSGSRTIPAQMPATTFPVPTYQVPSHQAQFYQAPLATAPLAEPPSRPAADSRAEGGLQMFGVSLSTATRDVMRQALRQEGLAVHREDEAFSEDIYDASNLMPGLLQLKFSYARDNKRLAKVDYMFMTFADTAHVEDVKLRIESRFGQPARVTGREESGPYQALWRLPDQMEILVGREWPQKTTYLRFSNVSVLGQAAAQPEREAVHPRREKIQNPNALPMWVNR
jgi:hypothetical protein